MNHRKPRFHRSPGLFARSARTGLVILVAALALWALSVASLTPASAQDPDDGAGASSVSLLEVLLARATNHVETGRAARAEITLNRIVAAFPDNLQARVMLARLHLDALQLGVGDVQAAYDAFVKHIMIVLVKEAAHPQANALMAELRMFFAANVAETPEERASELQEVIARARLALQGNPADTDTGMLLAEALAQTNSYKLAAETCAAVLTADSNHDRARWLLLSLLTHHDDLRVEDWPVYRLTSEQVARPGIIARRRAAAFDAAMQCVRVGDSEGALEMFDLALEHVPDTTIRLARRVVNRYDRNELPGRVTTDVVELLAADPFSWSEAFRATVAAQATKLDAHKVHELGGLLALIDGQTSRRLAQMGRPTAAVIQRAWTSLTQFVTTLDGGISIKTWPGLVELRAYLALPLDQMAIAAKDYEALADAFPDRPDFERRRDLLREAVAASVPPRAFKQFLESMENPDAPLDQQVFLVEEALRAAPTWGRAHLLRGDLAFNREGKYELALTHYEAAAKTIADEKETAEGIAFAHMLLPGEEHLKQAHERFKALADQHPDVAHFERFVRLLGDMDQGLVVHEAWIHYYLAVVSEDAGTRMEHLKRSHELQPTLAETLVALGQYHLGAAAEAMEMLAISDNPAETKKAMEAAFAEAERYFRGGVAQGRNPRQRADALAWHARLLFIRYRDIRLRDEANSRRADLERSRELLEKAIEMDPDAEGTALLLGQVYELLGDFAGTHRVYQSIMTRVPEPSLYRYELFDTGPPELDFPDGVIGNRVSGDNAGAAVSLVPEFVDGARYLYRLKAKLSGFLAFDTGLPLPDHELEFRVELVVRERAEPGHASVTVELRSVTGFGAEAYHPLLDRRSGVTISTLLGELGWDNPPAPEPPADLNAEQMRGWLENFDACCARFRSLVGPALIEAWAFSDGRPNVRPLDLWQKPEAGGVIHLSAPPHVGRREGTYLESVSAAGVARVVRLARVGGGLHGDLGHLRTELDFSIEERVTKRLRFEMMSLVQDAAWPPPDDPRKNLRDYAESRVELDLELLRVE